MTDTIFITRLVIHARHGVMEHETEVGQRFVIDLELSTDLSESSRTDHLSDTVSYANVVTTATAAFKNTNYKLLERAAGAVADAILAAFPAHRRRQGHRAQAACADRRDLRGCRRGADAHPATRRMASVLIALGGNVGDVRATFRKAIANICGMTQARCWRGRRIMRTPPWGDEQQTASSMPASRSKPASTRTRCCSRCTRSKRSSAATATTERRWGPRTLDLDLIAYDDICRQAGTDAAAPPPVRTRLCAGAARGDRSRPHHRRTQRPGRAGLGFERRHFAATRPGLTKRAQNKVWLGRAPWQFPAQYNRVSGNDWADDDN